MDFELMFESTGILEWILLSVFFISLLVQCFYYLGIYLRLPLYKPGKAKSSSKGISVVICARNEANNLERFLPLILEQDYPKFEVVVVNDCSTDGTEELLSEMKLAYDKLRYTNIPLNEKFAHGKKLALTVGLKAALYDHVVLTDADCYPAGKKWLLSMARNLGKENKIVLGYGSYEKQKGLLNILIRYETVFTAIQYLSFAIKGKPYMGVGRNLGYQKDLFFDNKGFAGHYHIASGDDDLFVNQHANKNNTSVEIEAESFTISIPKTGFGAWIRQKKRHLVAGNLYSRGSRFRLGLEIFSRMLLYASFTTLILVSSWLLPVTCMFGLFLIIRMSIFKLGMMRLKEKYLLLPSLLLDLALPLILGAIWISNLFNTKNQSWS
ncbi:MAG: glycosyltransferase [Bacteroides sp.]|nr:glycosyltransferase [Bacteroides sp.]